MGSDNAWSDAAQQVTPTSHSNHERFEIHGSTDEENYQTELQNLRAQIDIADQAILDTLGKRMKVAEAIGELKKDNNVAVLQNKRWNEILGKMVLEGEERNLSEEFILRLFKAIHQESINHQEQIVKG